MQIRKLTPRTVNLLLVVIALGLMSAGIYYCVRPHPTFMTVMGGNRSGALSAGEAAEFLTALSRSRPWDPGLAEGAARARQQANRETSIRVLVATLFVGGGLALGIAGGCRIAAGRKRRAVPPKIAPPPTGSQSEPAAEAVSIKAAAAACTPPAASSEDPR